MATAPSVGFAHLNRAPITEAVIDYRVQARDGITPSNFNEVRERLRPEFPVAVDVKTFEAHLGFDESGQPRTPESKHQHLGTMLRNEARAEVVQFRTDGFTFNKLAPYTSWNEIYPRAQHFWQMYCEVAKPLATSRVAVRFINKIRIPLPIGDLGDYLKTAPNVPQELPQQLRQFLTRVVLYEPSEDLSATVTQALEPSASQDEIVVLFDIDAFRDLAPAADPQQIDQTFRRLHLLKNKIFFNCLTDRALELFR